MGDVSNNEHLTAITCFSVFAALVIMGERVHEVFGFGAFAFLVFTMIDSYRIAELKARMRVEPRSEIQPARQDKTVMAWGGLLIILGVLFLIQNFIPYRYLNHLWPLVFILLGAYLVYRAVKDREEDEKASSSNVFTERKEF